MFDFLFFFNSIMIGVGLAMDAFSVSLANGLNDPCMRRRKMCLTAGIFALFQGAMPLIGWFLVHSVAEQFSAFEPFIPWIALALLSFIGGKMLFDGIKESRECEQAACPVCTPKPVSFGALIVQGIATSIDALSVGFTISEYGVAQAVVAAILIAAVTFAICLGGVLIGKKFGTALSCKSAIFGGAVLIFIGIEIFVTSFF
jgi:putative Mn2+ efflux pump MntP